MRSFVTSEFCQVRDELGFQVIRMTKEKYSFENFFIVLPQSFMRAQSYKVFFYERKSLVLKSHANYNHPVTDPCTGTASGVAVAQSTFGLTQNRNFGTFYVV